MSSRETGGERFARMLAAYGVSHVFHVPTVAVPALAAAADLEIVGITAHSEKAAAYMADGYARLSGRPGVCMSQAIGGSNLASGLRDACMAGSPVVAVTGGRDPKTRDRGVYQEVRDMPAFEALTKLNVELGDVSRVPDILRQAFRVATTGAPGPVHIELRGPFGQVLDEALEDDATPLAEPVFAAMPAFRPGAAPEAIDAALALLAGAERPVLLAGGGARVSGAHAEILALAERLGLPVATSLTGKGLVDETHPLALGCVGASSRPPANRATAEADLVLVVGSRLGTQTTDGRRLPAPGTPVIQVDIEPQELGRSHANAVSLPGDARTVLRQLLERSEATAARAAWLERVAGYAAEFRAGREAHWGSDAVPIRPERLCREITRALPDDGVLVVDTGHAGIWAAAQIDVRPGQAFLRCAGSLGWSYPASLGAKCAAPERPVVCFTGDGGLYFHLAELETAARHGIASVLVVNDNRSFSQDKVPFEGAFGPSHPVGEPMWVFNEVDIARVAEDLGCIALRVERPEDIAGALEEALAAGRPAVVDVVTDLHALPEPPHGGTEYYAAPESV